jgi:hypothetical protein
VRSTSRATGRQPLGDLAQALRVRGIGRADDDQPLDLRRDALHRLLAVGRGVADVFLVRAISSGKRPAGLDDLAGVVDRQRGLGDIGERLAFRRLKRRDVFDGLDQGDAPSAAAGPSCR